MVQNEVNEMQRLAWPITVILTVLVVGVGDHLRRW